MSIVKAKGKSFTTHVLRMLLGFTIQCTILIQPGIQQKNILVTCNYVARARGLTKLMYLKDAKEKCKDLVIVNGEDLTKYREMSDRIFSK